jgi:hypothetical protein
MSVEGTSMKVKIVDSAVEISCAYGSWLEHWQKFSGAPLGWFCSEIDCVTSPHTGTLVQRDDGGGDDKLYVVPLCARHHDMKGRTIELLGNTLLVPANSGHECEKTQCADESVNREIWMPGEAEKAKLEKLMGACRFVAP